MSIGLLRILVQQKLVPQENIEKYQAAVKAEKPVMPLLFGDKVITPESLAELCARLFNYPVLDLNYYPRSRVIKDVMTSEQMKEFRCIPLLKRGRSLYVGVSDPTQIQNVQKLAFASGLQVELVVVRDDQLTNVLDWFGQSNNELLKEMDVAATQLENGQAPAMIVDGVEEEDGPVARFIQKILADAVQSGASDIHFEFYEFMARVRFRADGQLREVVQPPLSVRNQLASRIKVMAKMDISEKRVPQDGRIQLQAINRPYGMVLVTGPTGSGKTVSLYTCLNILNTEDINISTAEDPAEINLPGINQVNVNDKQGLTFEAALKAFLRQDPDVIMIGEIRDLGTADIAIKAAQTGHMVFSTLHTNNAPATLSRMLNMGVAPFNIASAVNLIMAQRLARRLCVACKQPMERPPKEALLDVGFTEEDLAKEWTMYRPVGCDACKGKGYKGRAGLYEVMPMTEKMKEVIMKGGTEVDIANIAYEEGLVDLRRSGLLKVMQGITSLEEVIATTNE